MSMNLLQAEATLRGARYVIGLIFFDLRRSDAKGLVKELNTNSGQEEELLKIIFIYLNKP
jgi:hypothetical protein